MMEVLDAPAFWISPNGKLIPVYKTHIHEVIDYPLAFGLTDKYVKSLYKKYKEPLYSESTARCEIVADLIGKGWVRIRNDVGQNYYIIELYELNDDTKDFLWAWAKGLLKTNLDKSKERVKIAELIKGNSFVSTSIQEIADESLYGEKFSVFRRPLIVLKNAGQMLELGKWT
jgi:hypothetical protein